MPVSGPAAPKPAPEPPRAASAPAQPSLEDELFGDLTGSQPAPEPPPAASAPAAPSLEDELFGDLTGAPSSSEGSAPIALDEEAPAPAAAAADADEDDILGVEPPAAPPAGATLKIDRASLGDMIGEAGRQPATAPNPLDAFADPPARPAARGAAVASATATAVEVDADDPLFQEEGVEPTRLVPGAPQEILVPLEAQTPAGTSRYRLVLRLEVVS
jgi:hypothetical protein